MRLLLRYSFALALQYIVYLLVSIMLYRILKFTFIIYDDTDDLQMPYNLYRVDFQTRSIRYILTINFFLANSVFSKIYRILSSKFTKAYTNFTERLLSFDTGIFLDMNRKKYIYLKK